MRTHFIPQKNIEPPVYIRRYYDSTVHRSIHPEGAVPHLGL